MAQAARALTSGSLAASPRWSCLCSFCPSRPSLSRAGSNADPSPPTPPWGRRTGIRGLLGTRPASHRAEAFSPNANPVVSLCRTGLQRLPINSEPSRRRRPHLRGLWDQPPGVGSLGPASGCASAWIPALPPGKLLVPQDLAQRAAPWASEAAGLGPSSLPPSRAARRAALSQLHTPADAHSLIHEQRNLRT